MNRTDCRAIIADLTELIARARDAALPTATLQVALVEMQEASSPSSSNIAVRNEASQRFRNAREIARKALDTLKGLP